jgi:POT family proton-dependent oligopeptide transporter
MLVGLVTYVTFRRLLPSDRRNTKPNSTHAGDRKSEDGYRAALLILFVVAAVVLFRIGYEQMGNVVALWTRNETDRTLQMFGYSRTIPASWFQSVNPLLIMALTPFAIRLWQKDSAKVSPATLLRRMSIGAVLGGCALSLLMLAAVLHSRAHQPVSMAWVVGYFVLLTIGEIMLIPVGIALIETIAPARFASLAMGSWYIAKFVGSISAGVMGSFYEPHLATQFFLITAVSMLLSAALLYGLSRTRLASTER